MYAHQSSRDCFFITNEGLHGGFDNAYVCSLSEMHFTHFCLIECSLCTRAIAFTSEGNKGEKIDEVMFHS